MLLGIGACSPHNQTNVDVVSNVQIRAFNVDDVADVYLNGVDILQVPYLGDSGFVDITSLLFSGPNDLVMTDTNAIGVWGYGFEVVADGATIFSDNCGDAGSIGCDNDDTTTGLVYSQTITIQAP